MLQVQAVAVELGDPTGGDDDAGLVAAELEDVEGREEGVAEGHGDAVIGGGCKGQEVDPRGWRCGHDGAPGVGGAGQGGDGDREEGFSHCEYRLLGRIWCEKGQECTDSRRRVKLEVMMYLSALAYDYR